MIADRLCPKLYIWKNSRLYIGTSHLPFRKYTLAWSQLLVSITGVMRIQLDNGSEVETRTCMIKAGTVVDQDHINTSNAIIAIYYFNPISQDFFLLQNEMLNAQLGVCYQHPDEGHLIDCLHLIMNETLSTSQVDRLCREAIVPADLRDLVVKEFDVRIIETLQRIRATFRDTLPVSDYAADVHLSESRLNKLFKDQIGIPLTKYRLQIRLSVGIILLAAGYSVTDAAYEAGFSSSAHFSRCFSDMMGILPSNTFLKPPFMNAFISEDLIKAVTTNSACRPVC